MSDLKKAVVIFVQLLIFGFWGQNAVLAQDKEAIVYGFVKDTLGQPVTNANVRWLTTEKGVITNKKGYYEIKVSDNEQIALEFSYLSNKRVFVVEPLYAFQSYRLDVNLRRDYFFRDVIIEHHDSKRESKTNITKVDPKIMEVLPNVGGGIEQVVKLLPGVSSNSELSSGYSVRGGNFDENLVYINDIEIYRPFLVRSGQQEGLSMINPDLVENIDFSAGGFEARYGDKMSSVMAITYKQPDSFKMSLSGSMLGATGHLEGRSKDKRFSYLVGGRFQTNRYVLTSLDVQGDYVPAFGDLQAYFNYDLSTKWNIDLLSYIGANNFQLRPESRETTFGTPNQVMRLGVFFQGQEELGYVSFLNALSATYKPTPFTKYRFIVSAFQTNEVENFDIIGRYSLDLIDTDPGSEDFQESRAVLGVGGYHNHARNELNAQVYSFQHRGESIWLNDNELEWGVRYRREIINDRLKEWRQVDSSGYNVLHPSSWGSDGLDMYEVINGSFDLHTNRYSGYVQNTFTVSDRNKGFLTAGVRSSYWDYNEELIVTPRFQFSFKPNYDYNRNIILDKKPDSLLRKDITLKFAAGMYHQPPFYRELRDPFGQLNPELRAQKSYQVSAGSDVILSLWGRKFKWSTELYYKHLTDIVPYDVEDVRIRYFAENSAVGFATGMDMQLYGEFIPNLPSWLNFSIMGTQENIEGATYTDVNPETGDTSVNALGFRPRPTDQRFQVGIFFQDLLPQNPSYKFFLNAIYGTRLPFGPPRNLKFRNDLRMPPYRRVDVGFSKQILNKSEAATDGSGVKNFLKNYESVWVSLEIFNLLNIQNVISYLWVSDIQGNQYAIPNYLTTFRVNLRVQVKF